LRLQSRRAERTTFRRVGRIRALSTRIRNAIQPTRSHVATIPICLDASLYEPVPQPAAPTVGVLGSMFWDPSRAAAIRFLRHIAPRLRAARPGIRFVVGGWRAKEFLREYVKHDDVELLDGFPRPRDAFARLSALVYAPPIGTGMKVKILEAMAYGVPAVVNDEGFEGLEADPSPPVRLARSDQEIVREVEDLLIHPATRQRAIEEGRSCLRRSFSPVAVASALAALLSGTGAGSDSNDLA
jgi:glycosyltransferase involved in cell wall biosynthesis